MDNNDIAVKVENLTKTFRIPTEASSGLKQKLINLLQGKKGYREFTPLKDISFEVEKGDFFGIVGRNGSGKSTLLKAISGIYNPTKGGVHVNGTLVPFIELGVGFNPELTGRENVFLNGALLGFSHKEMEAMYDDIVEFAEIGEFMEEKLKNYSSGMQVRLAFSIAIRAESDILILDEVLAVGDEAFQRKCNEYFLNLKKSKKTVILVTHSMESVRKYCNRAMLINDGMVSMIGNPDEIADEYYDINLTIESKKTDRKQKSESKLSAKIVSKRSLTPQDSIEVDIKYRSFSERAVVAKAYIESFGQPLMVTNPQLLGWSELVTSDTDDHIVSYSLPLRDFNNGEYRLIVLLEVVDSKVNINSFGYGGEMTFKVSSRDKTSGNGILSNRAKMKLEK